MTDHKTSIGKISGKLMLKFLFFIAVVLVVIFISAGRLDYWQGWAYVGLNLVFLIFAYFTLSSDLIQERMEPEKGVEKWDKYIQKVSIPVFLAILIISALDGGRFYWYPQIPLYITIIGMFLYTLGQIIILWAKMVNKYFSAVVRIQTDRGHTVCKEGPYSFIRHPGYLGGLIYSVATPLVLGSFWGLIPVAISLILLFIRTYLEDKTLQKELDGYVEYTKEVRYRIFPHIW
ncbi:MAG TPA: isoprenylcysteine carboxylmethyltransferase family protein [Methanobacterium sp.]|uniref:methyltransferase family protein n=1 Tax=Methanobacterium sp. MZD130B TaxID=3394378 RepID=UPI00176A1319|nr:isoprenylcysteine carboxylmethyltransferase family protein [Methanobacterium sp.]